MLVFPTSHLQSGAMLVSKIRSPVPEDCSHQSNQRVITHFYHDFCCFLYIYIHTYMHTYIPAYIRTYVHTDRQTDRHTDIHIYIYTWMYINILYPYTHWYPNYHWFFLQTGTGRGFIPRSPWMVWNSTVRCAFLALELWQERAGTWWPAAVTAQN